MPKLSPLRMFGVPLKQAAQSSDCSEFTENGPIQDVSGFDSSGRGRNKAHNPLLEKNVAAEGTPERRPLAPHPSKSKLLWYQQQQQHQQQQQQQQQLKRQPFQDETGSDTSEPHSEQSTPTRRQHFSIQQVNKHGGSSQFCTPRASKIENKYLQMYSEPGSNSTHSCAATPKKSVSRSLKYNQDISARAQGTSAGFSQAKHGDHCSPAEFELEEDLTFWQDHNVQVLIRLRPISTLEVSLQGPGRCLRQDTSHSLTWCGHPESRFTFDYVACEAINQEKLFRVAGLPMVENCISGYNNCIFAYGQTGSGKTHTMLGDIVDLDQEQSKGRGMIPRVFEYLFVKIQLEEEARKFDRLEFVCKCSFLEIYNEQISDLLEPSSTNLQLREDVKKGVYVENLSEIEVKSVQDVIKLLLQGSANRKVAATNMNRESSRSHSVFTCVVESKWESDSVINTRFGRLNLVDLAGSERQKSSGAEGDRLKEAANINKSLSTLGLVIMVLVDAANGKPRHVPYRDSKLTFLLQDSLGGNSKTMIIATVSPSSSCSLETLSTLKFAQRAKFIRNNAIVNEDTFGDVVSLRQQIQQLKEEITQLRSQELRKSRGNEKDSNILVQVGQDVLTASLRREAAAESVIKHLGVEIGNLKRLVRQREEDAQRVKMLLRFREDKIRRLEAATVGSLGAVDYCSKERDALVEEVKLMSSRIEHNPEVTRFAMENIRLMDELKRFQDFYDHGEKEIMSTELSNMRDQLVEILEANAALKDECGVESHLALVQENEKLRSETGEMENQVQKLQHLQNENEDLVRQNMELKEQLGAMVTEIGTLRREHELSKARIDDLEVDREAHLTSISSLKLLLQQCEDANMLETQRSSQFESKLVEAMNELHELRTNLKEASEVQEQMESQQLLLINELESALLKQKEASQNDASVSVLKKQLQSLQLELRKKDQIRCLEKEFETAESNSNDDEKVRVESELLRTRQELEDAQELNRIFYREKIRRLSLEKQMDETRAEAEAETADAIASMEDELHMTNRKVLLANDHEREATEKAARLVDELRGLESENARLTSLCETLVKDKGFEGEEITKVWQQATSRLVGFLSEGDETLEAAAREMENILHAPLTDSSPEKRKATEVLQLKLQHAFAIVRDAEAKMQVLNEATSRMLVVQREEVLKATEAASKAADLEGRSSHSLRRAEKTVEVAFVIVNNLTEKQTQLRSEFEDASRQLLQVQHQRTGDAEVLSSLRSALELSEERANTLLLVVKRCADAECELRTEVERLTSINFQQQSAVSVLEEEACKKSKILEETQAKLQVAWEELIVQEITFDARSLEFSEKSVQMEKQLKAEFLKELEASSLVAEKKLSSFECRVAELCSEFNIAQEKCDIFESDYMAAVAELNHLDMKVQQLDDHIGLLEEENGDLETKYEAQKNIVEGLRQEAEAVQNELRSQVVLLHEELGKKEDSALTLQKLLLEAKDAKDNAEVEASNLHEELFSKASDLLNMEAVVSNAQEELSRAKMQLSELERELQSLRDSRASVVTENATLKSKIQDSERELMTRESQRKETLRAMENLKLESDEQLNEQKTLNERLQYQVRKLQKSAEDARALQTEQENRIGHLLDEISKNEAIVKGLEFDMSLLQESFADVTAKKTGAQESQWKLQQQLTSKSNDLAQVENLLTTVRNELCESTENFRLKEGEVDTLRDQNASLSADNALLTEKVQQLELERSNMQAELEEKCHLAESLDLELLELSSLVEQKIGESIASITQELKAVLKERDQLHADLLVATEQLEMAQALADEREIVATEARQVAEVSKAQAEEKDDEVKVLERSIGELESIVNALENQVGIIKREAQMQRIMKEDLETEVQSLRHEVSVKNGMIEASSMDEETVLQLREDIARLNEDCSEKEAQIEAYTKHIADLTTASTRQSAQYQQKITELETVIDLSKTKAKGSSSPFKCLGLSHQMNSEYDEELSAARQRIGELESIAAGRQREVFMLNSRLAEAESMTHDVVRDLLGVKVDITNYASLLSAEHARHKTPPSSKNEEEIGRLHKQMEVYIEERESCLEEINHRQAEVVAIRVAADKLRIREQTLTNENEKLKEEVSAFKRQQQELEKEVRKLSGQQNLQQRIHHHAKIKEENNSLKMKNDELSAKLRQTESRLNRVSDELTRYRSANGKPHFDIEEQLRSKLKEAEDDNLQMAQELGSMCKRVLQVAGVYRAESDMDSSVALEALQKLQEQLAANQKQLAELKLKVTGCSS